MFILLNKTWIALDPSSERTGLTAVATYLGPIPCEGCGEDLNDGPCRHGRVECWACGKRYPLYAQPEVVQPIEEVGPTLVDGQAPTAPVLLN